MTVLGVALGGALGALARYRLSGLVAVRQKTPFPAGTLVVNVVGSLLLGAMFGLVVAGRVSDSALAWGGVGFLGALTTFSTFTYETAILIEDGAWGYAARNAMLTIGLSFGAAALGFVALR
jgi:CrcB protein